MKLMQRWPLLQALPAYAVGVGVRPEHVRSPQRRRCFLGGRRAPAHMQARAESYVIAQAGL
jgi:hypothetical protein